MKTFLTSLLLLILCHLAVAGGFYLEFKISGSQRINGTMKAWSENGNSRSMIEMNATGMPAGMGNMSTLFLAAQPGKVFMINEKDKTYYEHEKQKSDDFKDETAEEYEVEVVGKETVNGYASTHVKIRKKDSKSDMDWWVSKDVKNYAEMKTMKAKYIYSKGIYGALAAKGIDGFPVRISVDGKREGTGMQMDLVKAEPMTIPASKFSLDGYTKTTTPGNPMMGMDPEKIKNMTPEERQKMMQEIMKQYGK